MYNNDKISREGASIDEEGEYTGKPGSDPAAK